MLKKQHIVLLIMFLLGTTFAKEIKVSPGVNAIAQAYATAEAGDVLVLTTGYEEGNYSTGYIEEKLIEITKDITIKAADDLTTKPVIFPVSTSKLFSIMAGLNLDGIVVDGRKPNGDITTLYNIIYMKVDTSLTKIVSNDFSLRINNCILKNMDKDKAKVMYSSDNNQATLDSIIITNTVIKDINGFGMYFKTTKSKHHPGTFRYLKWENCLVTNLGGSQGRMGIISAAYVNELENVPEVLVNHVTFANVNASDDAKGSELYVTDCNAVIQNCIAVNIKNDADSMKIFYNVADTVVSGNPPRTVIQNCLKHTNTPYYGFIADTLINNFNADPMFVDSANGDYTLKEGSIGKNAATDGLDLGYIPGGLSVGVDDEVTELPETFELSQNYPNPFNPSTVISFSIPNSGITKLSVYNILGQKVATLVNKELSAGSYQYEFDASNLTSGVYFYKLSSNNYSAIKKMMLVK